MRSRIAPQPRFVPRPRCNHHPMRAAKPVPLHINVGAASKTTLAERGGYTQIGSGIGLASRINEMCMSPPDSR